jgi:hypothetical protein
MATGTITGFGSVIVDGTRIDDSKASVTTENADGTTSNAEAKLGQQVTVQHDGQLSASAIHIEPEIVGQVSATDTTLSTLTVAGQKIAINTDSTKGPVTVFQTPYTSLADVVVNDWVEVHGVPNVDSVTGKVTIQATRIEKESAPPSFVRLVGPITGTDATAKTFKLGSLTISYTNAAIRPSGKAIADGEVVVVWVDATQSISTTNPVAAKFIRIKNNSAATGVTARAGGTISKLDLTAKTFEVDSIKIDASAATFMPTTKTLADLADGTYVRVIGALNADGSIKATTIVLRALEADFQIELHGLVTDFVSNASFKVRGVAVDASTATVDLSACPSGTTALANNLFIEVDGSLALNGSGVVLAKRVHCEQERTGISVMDQRGVASNVDTTAKTFTLTTPASGSIASSTTTVRWTALTFFKDVDPTTLSGKSVEVEGVLDSAAQQLVAGKIKLKN